MVSYGRLRGLAAAGYVLIINAAIFVVFAVIVDFSMGYFLNEPLVYLCRDPVLHHVYCPEATRVYKMEAVDGGRSITSSWNGQGLRVPSDSAKSTIYDTRDFDVVLVGDSFMEQRQVAYDERVSTLIESRTGAKTLQAGTGSWAIASYRNWIVEHQFKHGAKIGIFIMANDLYPYGYGMSNQQYHDGGVLIDGELRWPNQVETYRSTAMRFLTNNSYFFQWRFNRQLASSLKQIGNNHAVMHWQNVDTRNCETLSSLLGSEITPLAKSVAVQAFDSACWPREMQANVNSAVEDLKAIKAHLSSQGAEMYIFFIPNGWVLPHEASAAAASPGYEIDPNDVVPAAGIVDGLKKFVGEEVTSFEDTMAAAKVRRGEINQRYYYSADGHWNPLGSSVAADIIAETMDLSKP